MSYNFVPSSDPEVKKAIEEVLEDPEGYFERRRAAHRAAAHAEVQEAIRRQHEANKAAKQAARAERRMRLARWLGW